MIGMSRKAASMRRSIDLGSKSRPSSEFSQRSSEVTSSRRSLEVRRSRSPIKSAGRSYGGYFSGGAALSLDREALEIRETELQVAAETRRLRDALMHAEELAVSSLRKRIEREGGWRLKYFGIITTKCGLPGSKLVHPSSAFMSFMTIFSAILMLYSCLTSSFLVGFYWLADICDFRPATLYVDMFVDIVFLLEIVLCFFTGTWIKGEYTDSLRLVAAKYIGNGTILFDLVTSIPVSFVEYAVIQSNCYDGHAMNSDNEVRMVKTTRALRISRLLRAFKLLARLKSIVHLIVLIGDYLRIPPYVLRVIKIFVLLVLLVHLCACGWFLVKSASRSEEDFSHWLESENLDPYPTEGVSDKYVHSFYFVNTVFCTIGFGDISGKNTPERLYCVGLFYVGTFLFGSLLVEVQDAVNRAFALRRERDLEVNQMVEYLRSRNVCKRLERTLTNSADRVLCAAQQHHIRDKVLTTCPPHLLQQLKQELHHGMLATVPIFNHLESYQRESLLLDLWEKLKPEIFNAYTPIAASGNGKSELYVITLGTVILQSGSSILSTLHKGDSFGDDWLLLGEECEFNSHFMTTTADHDKYSADRLRYIAVTDVVTMVLAKEDFDDIVATYDTSIFEYFEQCRQRKREQNKQHVNEISGRHARLYSKSGNSLHTMHEDNPESEDAQHGGTSSASDDNVPRVRPMTIQNSLARARWINLVRRAYNTLIYAAENANGAQPLKRAAELSKAMHRVKPGMHSTRSPSSCKKQQVRVRKTSSRDESHLRTASSGEASHSLGNDSYENAMVENLRKDIVEMNQLFSSVMARTNIVIARHNILLEAREKSQNESREQSQNESESHSNSSTISRSGTRLAEEWPVKREMRALSASPLRGSEPPPAEPPPSLKGSEIDDNDWSGSLERNKSASPRLP